jgi:DNA-binding transcriptional MerR regulator
VGGMIRASQRVGLSISEIREALTDLPPRQVPTPEDWERLATRLCLVVAGRIDELFLILGELTSDAATPSGSRRTTCPCPSVLTMIERNRRNGWQHLKPVSAGPVTTTRRTWPPAFSPV